MRKYYPMTTVESFYNARKAQIEAKVIDSQSYSRSSSFEGKIAHSLYCLYEQVRDGLYVANWKARVHGHAWLSYDQATDNIVYDTRRRDDEWSSTLIDNILFRNNEENVGNWISFLETAEYKENMETACNYYDMTGNYFSKIRTKYRTTGIVSEYEYDRLVKNKYSTKVITAKNAEPRFPVGSLVSLRASHEETQDINGVMRCYKRDTTGNGILILSNNEPIISACKGAKRYKAVMVGDVTPFYIEERFIKKKKKIKVNKS